MKRKVITMTSLAVITVITLFSCKKEYSAPSTQVKTPAQLLIAKTWKMEKATEFENGIPHVLYDRTKQHNEEDFSLVRKTFYPNGNVTIIDEEGETSNNKWELLESNTKIKLTDSESGMFLTGENLKLSAGEFAYTIKIGNDSARFVFSQVP